MPIDPILRARAGHARHDIELWDFMARSQGRPLENLTPAALQQRLDQIDRGIQYLDGGQTPRDDLSHNHGWLSPWWWLRARHWTRLEFQLRGIEPATPPNIPPMPTIQKPFWGVVAGGQRLLARISREGWLLEMLERGRLRFAPAAMYDDANLGTARADDEMGKAYRRPGQQITISDVKGNLIPALGDVTFTSRRGFAHGVELVPIPYWLCSFSSDLDPRLFAEFGETGSDAAVIVVFHPEAFLQRAVPHLNAAAPRCTKSLFPTVYYDPYYPPPGRLRTLVHKDLSFACQREMRFVIDPEGRDAGDGNQPLFVDIGTITDIAGVYGADGRKIAGTGPASFLQ